MTIHSLFGGGAERVFSQLAMRWSQAGHEVHVITWSAATSDPRPLPAEIIRHGLDVLRPNRHVWEAFWAHRQRIGKLHACLRQLQPQLVLSFCDQMNISTLQATRGLGLPVWIAERSDPARQRLSPWWELRRRRSYPSCSGCIAQTEQIAEHLSRLIPRTRIVVIPNAVSVSNDGPQPGRSAAEFRNAESRNAEFQNAGSQNAGLPMPTAEGASRAARTAGVVLAVGRLAPEKGMDLLLRAWRVAQPHLGDWQLHIAGDGPLRAQLQQQAADLSAVNFLGWLSDPAPAYDSAQIFILPSRYEGFPNALLEAMSHGLACIATRCSQAVDQLAQQADCLLSIPVASSPEDEALNVTAMAAALMKLVNSQALRDGLGEAARSVAAGYTWDHIGPQWDRILTAQPASAAPLRESGSPPHAPSQ